MDIQLGRSKVVRRAYGIDEIALVPGGRTVDPEVTDTRWSIGGIEREIPIIASAMDGVVDVDMAVNLSRLGALGVINLEGVQTRYDNPNSVLDRIASVGKDEFVPLMQEIYSQPVQESLIRKRIQDIKSQGGIAAVSGTPVAALRFGKTIADAGADLFFVQATVVSTNHVGPEGQDTLDLQALCRLCEANHVLGAANLDKWKSAHLCQLCGQCRLAGIWSTLQHDADESGTVLGSSLLKQQSPVIQCVLNGLTPDNNSS